MAEEILNRIPATVEIRDQLAVRLREVDVLKRLLKVAEHRERIASRNERGDRRAATSGSAVHV